MIRLARTAAVLMFAAIPATHGLADDHAPVELKFQDFFHLPVGPGGLRPTATLLGLDGKAVRIRGYLVREDGAIANRLLLAPFPVSIDAEDESQADNLPITTLYVHGGQQEYGQQLVVLTGTLSVGPREEADGRISLVRLLQTTR